MTATLPLRDDEHIQWRPSIPFLVLHLVPFLAVFTGVSRRALILCAASYVVRMFFITAGYHRYFSHRSFKTNRAFQLVLAFGGTTATQKGPLWWASHHRAHHRHSDTELDVHTPLKGFWHSHVGWILSERHKDTDLEAVSDLARYPELRFLDRFDLVGPWTLAIASFLYAGWSGLVIGFVLSTVLLWHGTFLVNSLAHVMGRRRYATRDTSRNSALIAVLTLGEGWHNNHHHFPVSARQGFFWWELDPSYYVLRVLSWFRIVRDLRVPSEKVRTSARVAHGTFDVGMFRAHWSRAQAALARSRPTLPNLGDTAIGQSLAARRDSLVETLQADREALEEAVGSSLRAAELYAKRVRRAPHDLGASG